MYQLLRTLQFVALLLLDLAQITVVAYASKTLSHSTYRVQHDLDQLTIAIGSFAAASLWLFECRKYVKRISIKEPTHEHTV